MLMSFSDLIATHAMRVHGVLHLGAHLAEEAPIYDAAGVGDVWWVEANPGVLDKISGVLEGFPGQRIIHALIYEKDGVELDLNITNYEGMSSSILEFGTHPTFSPDTVFVDKWRTRSRSVDSIVDEYDVKANLLSMDLQGAELSALKGATEFLRGVDYVLTEVNNDEVYVGCAKVGELDNFLIMFDRVATHWVGTQGWGDALYIRRTA